MNQMDRINSSKMFYPNTKEYTLLAPHTELSPNLLCTQSQSKSQQIK